MAVAEVKQEKAQKVELVPEDEKLLDLLQQTSDGFQQGVCANYMNGLQEMLALLREPQTSFENPYNVVC